MKRIDVVVGATVVLEVVDVVVDEDVSDEMAEATAIIITITATIPINVIFPIPTRSFFSLFILGRNGSDYI